MEAQSKQADHLNDLLEDALDDLLKGDDIEDPEQKLQESQNLPEVTGVSANGGESSKSVKKILNEARLGTSSNNSSNNSGGFGGVDEEEMDKFFETMAAQLKAELPKIDPKEAQAKINESVPQIFDLMQNLLSKELLYPALKDLSPKFDEWLKKNALNLTKADKKRYRKQKDIINEIIYVFDDETIDAQERFEKNLDLMEKMQSLGSPPEELTVPEGMGKCSVM